MGLIGVQSWILFILALGGFFPMHAAFPYESAGCEESLISLKSPPDFLSNFRGRPQFYFVSENYRQIIHGILYYEDLFNKYHVRDAQELLKKISELQNKIQEFQQESFVSDDEKYFQFLLQNVSMRVNLLHQYLVLGLNENNPTIQRSLDSVLKVWCEEYSTVLRVVTYDTLIIEVFGFLVSEFQKNAEIGVKASKSQMEQMLIFLFETYFLNLA